MKHKVIVRRVTSLVDDLRDCLETLSFNVSNDDYVVIKPNLCDLRSPLEGGTTDVQVVESLIKVIREKASPRIAIVESDNAFCDVEEEFERLGYRKLSEKYGVDLINLSKDKKYELCLNGYFFKYLKTPETLLRMTKFICVAKLKTHFQQKITCIMKNQFGLLPEKYKAKYHPFMSEVLVDLNETFRPDLCLIDAIIGMEGFGPSEGKAKKVEEIICGTDYFSTDVVAARRMGFNPKSVPSLKFVEKHGLRSTKNIEIISEVNAEKKFEFIPFYAYRLYRTALFTSKMGYKIRRFCEVLSNFLSQAGTGLIVLIKGYHITSHVLRRRDVVLYLKGLALRIVTLIRLKIGR